MVERGFTLIELCLALVVLAIISMIAWGQYQDYVVRARQGEAKIQLLGLLHQLERSNDITLVSSFHTEHYQFLASRTEDHQTGLGVWLVQALPQASMTGTGGFGLDSRGYSCFTSMQDAACIPQPRESWN